MRTEADMHNYQIGAAQHIMNNPHCGLFLEMSLGKTIATLTAIDKLLYETLDVNKVLIIAPKRVAENVWTSELKEWSHISRLKISRIIGNEKQRKAALVEKSDIYTISRDNIAWLCGLYGGSMLPFDMVVIDESSSFKNHQSQRFKALKFVQPTLNRVVLLTGTPSPKGLIDLWAQLWLLDRGERLGKTITSYRDTYFRPGKRKGEIIYTYDLKEESEKLIYDKIGDICISMKTEDYLELPPYVLNDIIIDFPEKLRKDYDKFERDKVIQLLEGGSEITAVNAAALSSKLRQFANGAMYDENRVSHEIHDLKLDALGEIVEAANGNPVLVAYAFIPDRERILKRLKKYKTVFLQKEQDIEDWKAGKTEVLVMHPASGGHGLNLQSGGHIIVWFGCDWSLELYQQLNARLRRPGQDHPVIVNRILIKGTEDQSVTSSLERKDTVQEGVMQALKAKLEKYKKYVI